MLVLQSRQSSGVWWFSQSPKDRAERRSFLVESKGKYRPKRVVPCSPSPGCAIPGLVLSADPASSIHADRKAFCLSPAKKIERCEKALVLPFRKLVARSKPDR